MDDLNTGTWVTYVGSRPARIQYRRCCLEVVGAADDGARLEFAGPRVVIGARAGVDLRLKDVQVSGLHCEILVEARGYRVRDLGSKNGTFLGTCRLSDAFIAPETTLRVGQTQVRFRALDDAQDVELSAEDRFGELLGQSACMRELFAKLERIAASDATVLVQGETGTGKELVASAIHERSARAVGPLIIVDCGALPATLFESELFGHERGAFTGATETKRGALERARHGTLFLDEIGELPLELQAKLLRAVESRTIRRVGGSRELPIDARIIAATNRDLAKEINRGRFREDLYYRLAVLLVHVPPLRERLDDIPLLVDHFIAAFPGASMALLPPDLFAQMEKHEWPGNVRELRNFVERALALPAGSERMLVRGSIADTGGVLEVMIDLDVPFKQAKQRLIESFEARFVHALLARHGGNVSAAARATGLDRMSIHRMLQRLPSSEKLD